MTVVTVTDDMAVADASGVDQAALVDLATSGVDLKEIKRRVFLSAVMTYGYLANADSLCSQEAVAAGLGGGPYHAVLATRTQAASALFSGVGAPIYTPNDDLVAMDNASFFSANHQFRILTLADGTVLTSAVVWTGMNGAPNTPAVTKNCGNNTDWTDPSATLDGTAGAAQFLDGSWANANRSSCNSSLRLYCLGEN